MNINWNDPYVIGVIGSIIGAIIFAAFGFFFKRMAKSGVGLFRLVRQGMKEKTGLDIYLNTLEEHTLLITHPWMKEEQKLTNILVPIFFETDKMSKREELEPFLARMYKQNPALRLVITGKPGSGKTIAMRVIARSLRFLNTENQPVPVLMTFSDIKGFNDPEKLERLIIEKLKFYQFHQGKNDDSTVERFVKDNLYTGKLFLLFDGYDELDKSDRETAAKLLKTFLGTNSLIPAAISSRTAVYESEPMFDSLRPCKISMAPFTPFAILKFLSLWRFEGNKSAQALFEMINGKAHLSELASNPLMLTIIAFLYSLPKYTLPDNRVEFYELCTRALLEEWDRSQQRNRANRFESHQKIAVLNRIAFQHVSTVGIDDELIREGIIHTVSREEMARLSLRVEEYPLMKKEIVENSGLLQKIPPTDYRFPHRTFMEFFAASFIEKEKNAQDMLTLYYSDPTKWKEVLLLYLGLNKNKEYANTILKRLADDARESIKAGTAPDNIVFSALTQCAVPDPQTAVEILDLARQCLITLKNPVKEIVEELGYIAANSRWAYSQKAKIFLLELLNQEISDRVFQQVIFSLLYAGDRTLDAVILENIKRVNLVEFFSKLGATEKYFIHKLFSLDLPLSEKGKMIDGLKEAGNFDLLGHLLIEDTVEPVRKLAAWALFRMSKLAGFYEFLDRTETGLLDGKTKSNIDFKYKEWGWRWDLPRTGSGQKLAHLICFYAANWIAKNRRIIDKKTFDQVANRFRYLATGFLKEEGIPFHKFNLLGFKSKLIASRHGLKKYWQKSLDIKRGWYKICSVGDGAFWAAVSLYPYWLISLLGSIGFILYLFGSTGNGFYRFFFDPFTVLVVCLQFVLFYISIFIYSIKDKDKWGWSLGGPIILIDMGTDVISGIPGRFIVFILAVGSLFIPFHHIVFNIVFFLYFFIFGQVLVDWSHIDFAFFDIENVKRIQEFLDEVGEKGTPD